MYALPPPSQPDLALGSVRGVSLAEQVVTMPAVWPLPGQAQEGLQQSLCGGEGLLVCVGRIKQ